MNRVIQPKVKDKSQKLVQGAICNGTIGGGLHGKHGKHALQRGIWVPTQHFIWDKENHGKP
jgi:hypothetical protein